MNIKKIIKEEVDDFDWIKSLEPTLDDANVITANLIPSGGISGGNLITKISKEFRPLFDDINFMELTRSQMETLFDNLNLIQRVAMFTHIIDNVPYDDNDVLIGWLKSNRNYLTYIKRINLINWVNSVDDLNRIE